MLTTSFNITGGAATGGPAEGASHAAQLQEAPQGPGFWSSVIHQAATDLQNQSSKSMRYTFAGHSDFTVA